ncbi:MAG: glycosyltransferase family 4 protein [Candidatus Peribacteraceae bacterium]|nr:glycosyltransferase family 4 protein [Candidatus Peribacteraceae bacterium]MDD5074976.1 glycosyltransferase family 4 protein [Candidatus Peribacteraceae bacterium]
MKIVLATGIYPPSIGGPATYVAALAREFEGAGHEVVVVTYGVAPYSAVESCKWKVNFVSKRGGPFLRWWRYARVLQREGSDADIVYAFSSVSAGIPVMLARLKKPKKVLRLGGDFFWERYTDAGGELGLREWYENMKKRKVVSGKWKTLRLMMAIILRSFDHIVFSTFFEEGIYEHEYRLPPHSVIENAFPKGQPVPHAKHDPFRLLFMGRFVGFKNLPSLVRAVALLPGMRLTLVGSGPSEGELRRLASQILATDRVRFLPPLFGEEKDHLFAEQDLLIIPSITELSPNVALEARSSGLPVLLTRETGLSARLSKGMTVRDCSTPEKIAAAVRDIRDSYGAVAHEAALPVEERPWEDLAREHLLLFERL